MDNKNRSSLQQLLLLDQLSSGKKLQTKIKIEGLEIIFLELLLLIL